MSLRQLNEIITKAAKAVYDNEKFAVGVLAVRARKAAEAYPTDKTILTMAGFLSKRAASSNALFITRAELKDVYNRLYSQNNKFAELFMDELGLVPTPDKVPLFNRDKNEGKNLVEGAYEKLADPVLSNALASAFDKSIPYRPYSDASAKNAQMACEYELSRLGLPSKKINVLAGQLDLLICQASYDTPKGESHVLLPIEIKNGQALLPTVFLSRVGFVDLDSDNLKTHIVSSAGKSFKVNVDKILQTVSIAKNGTVEEPMNEVEKIVLKATMVSETPISHTPNAILYQQVDQIQPMIEEPIYEQPAEVQSFAERMTSKAGIAEFTLGKQIVDAGRQLIRKSMSTFGYPHTQVAIADSTKDSIIYAVAIDTTSGFKVPVKIEKGKLEIPTLLISANGLADFSKEGVSEALSEMADQEVLAVASPVYGQKPSDLIKQIRDAMAESNYLKAEDALNVLQKSGDVKAFQTGYEVYVSALSNGGKPMAKTASISGATCKMPHKVANSKYIICGHTNLPLHKVYQDKNGDCHPLYRKGMSETAEGGSFLHSKIYMG